MTIAHEKLDVSLFQRERLVPVCQDRDRKKEVDPDPDSDPDPDYPKRGKCGPAEPRRHLDPRLRGDDGEGPCSTPKQPRNIPTGDRTNLFSPTFPPLSAGEPGAFSGPGNLPFLRAEEKAALIAVGFILHRTGKTSYVLSSIFLIYCLIDLPFTKDTTSVVLTSFTPEEGTSPLVLCPNT
jgi:hypothetical protein